ncbi:MAG: hrcR [Hyphomicrobiales bacterium]|nr:hrcR [Hyphomicrobiales bacterium]
MSGLTPLLTLMTFVGLIPLLAVVSTAFTKITIVLLIVRNALGIQQTPPNLIIFSIAMILSLNIMQPVTTAALARVPVERLAEMPVAQVTAVATEAAEPFRQFMMDNSAPASREMFAEHVQRRNPKITILGTEYSVVIPAFLLDELTKAFKTGFLIYIPFIAIDFIVSAVLIALGMQMISATAVATPLKILLFVQVNGWERLFDMLLLSYK